MYRYRPHRTPVSLILPLSLALAAPAQARSKAGERPKAPVCMRASGDAFKLYLPRFLTRLLVALHPHFDQVEPERCGDGVDNDCDRSIDEKNCVSVCGDGFLQPGEACDDGNLLAGDGCDQNCEVEAECGNGVVEIGEACDTSAEVDGGCCVDCKIVVPTCGNGITECGEQCDEGAQNGEGDCSQDCQERPPAPDSVFAINGEDCARCTQARCAGLEPDRFDPNTQEALSCMLVTGCIRPGQSSIGSCYCGTRAGDNGAGCFLEPEPGVPMMEFFPDGACRKVFEDITDQGWPFSSPEAPLFLDKRLSTALSVANACVRDQCLEECRPEIQTNEFLCGDRRCKIDSEYCSQIFPGIQSAVTTYECIPLISECFDNNPNPNCYECVAFTEENASGSCYGEAETGFTVTVSLP